MPPEQGADIRPQALSVDGNPFSFSSALGFAPLIFPCDFLPHSQAVFPMVPQCNMPHCGYQATARWGAFAQRAHEQAWAVHVGKTLREESA
jgi:hypothetical protein